MNFINAHPLGCLKPELSLQLVHIVTEDVADSFFVQAGLIGQTGEGAREALPPDPCHQSVGHFSFGVDSGQQLGDGFATGLAAPPARCHVDGRALAVRGQVPDHLVGAAMADQTIRTSG